MYCRSTSEVISLINYDNNNDKLYFLKSPHYFWESCITWHCNGLSEAYKRRYVSQVYVQFPACFMLARVLGLLLLHALLFFPTLLEKIYSQPRVLKMRLIKREGCTSCVDYYCSVMCLPLGAWWMTLTLTCVEGQCRHN